MASLELEEVVQSNEENNSTPPPTSVTDPAIIAIPLSKKAQKKAAKAAHFAAHKLERRAKEKEAKKAKKRIRAEKRAAGELEEDEVHEEEEKRRMMKRARTGAGQKPFGATVCVDLGFDDMMNDKEIISLVSQLGYVYSANRRSICPFSSVLFTSVNGRTFTRLETMNNAAYKRWTGTEWWQDGYERLWKGKRKEEGSADCEEETTDGSSRTALENVVYLTADSDEELLELKEGETYIIGGIVDHNRYKNLCLNKANESKIRTARLPIGRFLASLTTRKILTVNQVFEILVKWVEARDWEQAMYSIIPKRKFDGEAENDQQGAEDVDAADEEEVRMLEQSDRIAEGVEEAGGDEGRASS